MRNIIYLRFKFYYLSQDKRIIFVRIFRHLTKDSISNALWIAVEIKKNFNKIWDRIKK